MKIPKKIRCNYTITVHLHRINKVLEGYSEDYNLDMLPDFQRGHVWTEEQQVSFCEHLLSGGYVPPVLFNCADWAEGEAAAQSEYKPMVIVDGLQRITAIQRMLNGELRLYGVDVQELEDYERTVKRCNITFGIGKFTVKADVLRWYLELNAAGTPHADSELKRVTDMLCDELMGESDE